MKRKNNKELLSKLLMPIVAIVVALVIGAVFIGITGKNPIEAYSALFRGAFGTPVAFFTTLGKATPLILTGLAVSIAFKCKMLNIGGEGQMLAGAFAAAITGAYLTGLPAFIHIPITIIAGMAFGGIWAILPALLKIKRNVHPVISTIMLNYVAVNLVRFLVSGPFKAPGETTATLPIQASAKLPFLLPAPYRLSLSFLIALICVVVIWVIMNKTVLGYNIKAVGYNEDAAKYAGMNITKTMLIAFIISGALAGLAGSMEVTGSLGRLYDSFSGANGFDGIPVALLAGCNPFGVVLTSLLFSALRTGATTMQTSVGISKDIVQAIQGIIILFIAAEFFFRHKGHLIIKNMIGNKLKRNKKEAA